MQLQKIAVAGIVMDKPNDEDRSFSKEFCENLAKSIESEGLINPPTVRPIADKPGKYRVVAGRNRIYACGKILKWTEIDCFICPESISDDEAKAIEDAENIWRNNLSDAQLKKALIRWQKIYDAKHPAASGKGTAQKQAAIVKKKVEEAAANGEVVDVEKVVEQVAADNKPFSKVLAETLKVSIATAERLARVSKHLEPEQIDVLEKHKVTNHVADQLAGLGSQELIVKAINLIASGMDHAEAVRQAGKTKRDTKAAAKFTPPDPANGKQGKVPKPPKEAMPAKPKEKELTDDEWLTRHCDMIMKLLKRKGPFKRDAILYRRLGDTLVKFRGSCKKPLAEAKGSDGNGGFFGSLTRVVKAAHPSNWLVCGGCNGQGWVLAPGPDGKEAKQNCNQCHGAAYKIKVED